MVILLMRELHRPILTHSKLLLFVNSFGNSYFSVLVSFDILFSLEVILFISCEVILVSNEVIRVLY